MIRNFAALLYQHYYSYYAPLALLIALIINSPIPSRKTYITFCQLGIFDERSLRRAIQVVPQVLSIGSKREQKLSFDAYYQCFEEIAMSRMCRSILWIIARTCPEPEDDQSRSVIQETFFKEFDATQIPFSRVPLFDYSIMHPLVTGVQADWAKLAKKVARTFAWRLNGINLLYPQVQRTKNVSQETAQNYIQYRPGVKISSVTTCMLERLYAETGFECPGSCEMRQAWRFNDLKPRVYYCTGGTQYFRSRYMKRLAVELMESIGATARRRRTDLCSHLPQDFFSDTVVAWDFTNFTSNLSDLKYFLASLCRALEDLPVHDIRVVDSREGLKHVAVHELLDEYNRVANEGAEFSIHRLINSLNIDLEESKEYHTQNSGLLGVHGNIGFSTANHGFIACTVCGEKHCVCVGDDALGVTEDEALLIRTMTRLGTIAPEKFSILGRGEEGPIKFLKRALYRDEENYFVFDELFNLVNPCLIDERYGHRTVLDMDYATRKYKIATQIGALYWYIYDLPENRQLDDDDMQLLRMFLNPAYYITEDDVKLPPSGFLPGYFDAKGQMIHYGCPPVSGELFDPRYQDWLEYLFEQHKQEVYKIPVMVYQFDPRVPYKGESISVPMRRSFRMLEDLGIVTLKQEFEVVTFMSEVNKRTMRKHFGRLKDPRVPLVTLSCVNDIPHHFYFFFDVPSFEMDVRLLSNTI